jgi:hypothetical protein
MNASLSEDSVAETALAKKNSDGKIRGKIVVGFGKGWFVNDGGEIGKEDEKKWSNCSGEGL